MKVTIRVLAQLLQKGRPVDNPNFVRDKPVASFFKFHLSKNSVLNICCLLMCMFVTGAHRIGSCCTARSNSIVPVTRGIAMRTTNPS